MVGSTFYKMTQRKKSYPICSKSDSSESQVDGYAGVGDGLDSGEVGRDTKDGVESCRDIRD